MAFIIFFLKKFEKVEKTGIIPTKYSQRTISLHPLWLVNIFLHVSVIHFRFEGQQAKIFVSQLKCDPYHDPPFGDRLDDINSKLEKLNTQATGTGDRLDDVDSKLEKFKNTGTGTVWFDVSR